MEPTSEPLGVTRSDKPGQRFEMVVNRFRTGHATVTVNKIGLFQRQVAVRDVHREHPQWADAGDVIWFAGQAWIPEDHEAAVSWMRSVQTLTGSPSQPGSLGAIVGTDSIGQKLDSLQAVGAVLQVAAVVVGILGVVGGVILAFQTEYSGYNETHPYVGAGVGVAVSAAFTALMAYVVGSLPVTYATVNLHRQRVQDQGSGD